MTTWTDVSTTSTSWNAGNNQSTSSVIKYNDVLAYNLDYITYNGYYVENETDWAGASAVSTAWKEPS